MHHRTSARRLYPFGRFTLINTVITSTTTAAVIIICNKEYAKCKWAKQTNKLLIDVHARNRRTTRDTDESSGLLNPSEQLHILRLQHHHRYHTNCFTTITVPVVLPSAIVLQTRLLCKSKYQYNLGTSIYDLNTSKPNKDARQPKM